MGKWECLHCGGSGEITYPKPKSSCINPSYVDDVVTCKTCHGLGYCVPLDINDEKVGDSVRSYVASHKVLRTLKAHKPMLAALRKYGIHTVACCGVQVDGVPWKCTCGYAAAIAAGEGDRGELTEDGR